MLVVLNETDNEGAMIVRTTVSAITKEEYSKQPLYFER